MKINLELLQGCINLQQRQTFMTKAYKNITKMYAFIRKTRANIKNIYIYIYIHAKVSCIF